jgi:hypothetical protein
MRERGEREQVDYVVTDADISIIRNNGFQRSEISKRGSDMERSCSTLRLS